MTLFTSIHEYIEALDTSRIPEGRKAVLQSLIDYINAKQKTNEVIRLNFICTHNSRRSHLAQIWAQTAAAYFNIKNIECYSGGTEVTAVFPKVISTLKKVGYKISHKSKANNPIYEISFSNIAPAIVAFSKKYDDSTNPISNFAAVMTCSQADAGCPFVAGSDKRISITYEDPKVADGTPQQQQVYNARSKQIATEMKYVFSKIN